MKLGVLALNFPMTNNNARLVKTPQEHVIYFSQAAAYLIILEASS